MKLLDTIPQLNIYPRYMFSHHQPNIKILMYSKQKPILIIFSHYRPNIYKGLYSKNKLTLSSSSSKKKPTIFPEYFCLTNFLTLAQTYCQAREKNASELMLDVVKSGYRHSYRDDGCAPTTFSSTSTQTL